MNNNQTQQTNQPKSNRFHLKTWQWVSVLAVGSSGLAMAIKKLN